MANGRVVAGEAKPEVTAGGFECQGLYVACCSPRLNGGRTATCGAQASGGGEAAKGEDLAPARRAGDGAPYQWGVFGLDRRGLFTLDTPLAVRSAPHRTYAGGKSAEVA